MNSSEKGKRSRWTRASVVEVMRSEMATGRRPNANEWQQADPTGRRPSFHTVRHLFGSWSAALVAADIPVAFRLELWQLRVVLIPLRAQLAAGCTSWADLFVSPPAAIVVQATDQVLKAVGVPYVDGLMRRAHAVGLNLTGPIGHLPPMTRDWLVRELDGVAVEPHGWARTRHGGSLVETR